MGSGRYFLRKKKRICFYIIKIHFEFSVVQRVDLIFFFILFRSRIPE